MSTSPEDKSDTCSDKHTSSERGRGTDRSASCGASEEFDPEEYNKATPCVCSGSDHTTSAAYGRTGAESTSSKQRDGQESGLGKPIVDFMLIQQVRQGAAGHIEITSEPPDEPTVHKAITEEAQSPIALLVCPYIFAAGPRH